VKHFVQHFVQFVVFKHCWLAIMWCIYHGSHFMKLAHQLSKCVSVRDCTVQELFWKSGLYFCIPSFHLSLCTILHKTHPIR
jgi:hypothetical protein